MTLHPIFADITNAWRQDMSGVYQEWEDAALAEVEEARHEDYWALCLEWINMAEGLRV